MYHRTLITGPERRYVRNLAAVKKEKERQRKLQSVPLGAKIKPPKACIMFVLPDKTKIFSDEDQKVFSLYRKFESGKKYSLINGAIILNKMCHIIYSQQKRVSCVDGYVDKMDRGIIHFEKHGLKLLKEEGEYFSDEPGKKKTIEEMSNVIKISFYFRNNEMIIVK